MDIAALIDGYVATWNEVDGAMRRRRVEAVWSDGASLYNRTFEYHGHDGVEKAVTRSYDLFVVRGFRFRARGELATHHGAIRFSWEMITAGGEVDSLGTQFLVLGDDGRVALDYQFSDTPQLTSADLRDAQ
jgi:hypothetical protein